MTRKRRKWLLVAWTMAVMNARALAAAPSEQILLPMRVHVFVTEELPPDALRALAKPNVVLWVQTRTNLLRASLLERLGEFSEVYVRMRPPVLAVHRRQLDHLPRVGIWMDEGSEGDASLRSLRPHPTAISVRGPLTPEAARRIEEVRPRQTRWEPAKDDVSLEAFGLWLSLPGQKTLVAPSGFDRPICEERARPLAGAQRGFIEAEFFSGAASLPSLPGCGLGQRLWVTPELPSELLASLGVRDRSVELRLNLGADEDLAQRVHLLLQRIQGRPVNP